MAGVWTSNKLTNDWTFTAVEMVTKTNLKKSLLTDGVWVYHGGVLIVKKIK